MNEAVEISKTPLSLNYFLEETYINAFEKKVNLPYILLLKYTISKFETPMSILLDKFYAFYKIYGLLKKLTLIFIGWI